MPGRRFFEITGPLPLVVPSYVGAAIMLDAFGPRGLLQQLLESPFGVERLPSIYGFFGAWRDADAVHLPLRAAAGDCSLQTDRPGDGRGRARPGPGPGARRSSARRFPSCGRRSGRGGLLCALYAISDFGVVSLMRFDTFTRAIYNLYRSFYDPGGAALLASLVIILTGMILAFEHRLRVDPQKLAVRSARSAERTPAAIGRWRYAGVAFCLTDLRCSRSQCRCSCSATGSRPARQADWFDAETTRRDRRLGQRLGLGRPRRHRACRCRSRSSSLRHSGRAARVIEADHDLGFALPGVVVALGLVFFATRFAGVLYQTLTLLVIAYVIRFIPQAIEGARARTRARRPGARRGRARPRRRPLRVFRRVTLPLAAPGVAAGAMLVFLTAMKELPATLILKPTGFETLATRIWEAVKHGLLLAGSGAGADPDRDLSRRAGRRIVQARRHRPPAAARLNCPSARPATRSTTIPTTEGGYRPSRARSARRKHRLSEDSIMATIDKTRIPNSPVKETAQRLTRRQERDLARGRRRRCRRSRTSRSSCATCASRASRSSSASRSRRGASTSPASTSTSSSSTRPPEAGKFDSWDDVPDEQKDTFEKLGIPQAEREYLAGVVGVWDKNPFYEGLKKEYADLGIIFCAMDTAVTGVPGARARSTS